MNRWDCSSDEGTEPTNREEPTKSGDSIPTSAERATRRFFHAGIVAAIGAGVRRGDPSVIVNGCLSLFFAALPGHLTRRYGVRFKPWQGLWVSASALVHTVGMLGPYDRIWWWDHLAHTLSGVVVAAAADIVHRSGTVARENVPPLVRSRPSFVVGTTLTFGAIWELFEYIVHAIADRLGFEPLLVHYGRLDAVGDLFFDALGAGLVVKLGKRTLSNVVDSTTERR